jgi:hypothetical protein
MKPLLITLFGGLATGGGALVIVGLTLAKGGNWLAFAIPGVGIVLFLGVALLGRYAEPANAEAAIRHGLAAGFLGAYLTVLGFSLTDAAFDPSLVKNLTWVVGVVVTFYFGSTTVSQFIASKNTTTTTTTTSGTS